MTTMTSTTSSSNTMTDRGVMCCHRPIIDQDAPFNANLHTPPAELKHMIKKTRQSRADVANWLADADTGLLLQLSSWLLGLIERENKLVEIQTQQDTKTSLGQTCKCSVALTNSDTSRPLVAGHVSDEDDEIAIAIDNIKREWSDLARETAHADLTSLTMLAKKMTQLASKVEQLTEICDGIVPW